MKKLVAFAVFWAAALPGVAEPVEPTLQQKAAIISHIRHARALTAEHPTDNPEYGWAFELYYRLAHPMPEEQFKAGLMLAAACVSLILDRAFPPPCNDGLAILSAHAADIDFKNAISFDVGPGQERCIAFLRDRIRTTTGVTEFADLEAAALEDHKKAADEQEGRERPERPEPSNPGYNHPPAPGHCGFNSSGAYCD